MDQQHSDYSEEEDDYDYEIENIIHSAHELSSHYAEDIKPLLSEAELRLVDEGNKFRSLKKKVGSHFTQWRDIVGTLQKHALQYRNDCNTLFVTKQTLEGELSERDKIIQTLKRDHLKEREEYEKHLTVLEGVIANSKPPSAASAKLHALGMGGDSSTGGLSNAQLSNIEAELKEQLKLSQKQEIQRQKLESNLKIMNAGANELQSELIKLNEDVAKKDDDLLKLRWTIEDLQNDRTALETEIANIKQDPTFSSAKINASSANDDSYTMDFSKFVDEDDDDPTDPASSGFLPMDIEDDADISSHVQEKLREALNAAQKVTQFAAERDRDARNLETGSDKGVKFSKSNHNTVDDDVGEWLQRPIPNDINSCRHELVSGKEIVENLQNDIDDLQMRLRHADPWDMDDELDAKRRDSTEDPDAEAALAKKKSKHERFFSTYNLISKEMGNSDQMVQQLGQYDALVNITDNEKTYSLVMDSLRMKLKNGQAHANMLEEHTREMLEEMQLDDDDPLAGDSGMNQLRQNSIKQTLDYAGKLSEIVDEVIDELKGAEQYVHPDQKRVELLEIKVKELENTMPYIAAEKLAILTRLPKFIHSELASYNQRKKLEATMNNPETSEQERTRAKQAHDLAASKAGEDQKGRVQSYNAAMDSVKTQTDTISGKAEYISSHLIDMLEAMIAGVEDEAEAELHQRSIAELKQTVAEIEECCLDLKTEFEATHEFVHPVQRGIVIAASESVEKSIQIQKLQREIQSLRGELEAAQEELMTKPKSDEKKNIPPTGVAPAEEKPKKRKMPSWGFGSMDLDFLKYAEFELKDNTEYGLDKPPTAADEEELDKQAREFLPNLGTKIGTVKERGLFIHNLLTESGLLEGANSMLFSNVREVASNIDTEINYVTDLLDEMRESIGEASNMVGADSRYIARLEKRYQQIKGLYKMKFAEVENMKDNLYHSNQQLEAAKREIDENEFRLQQIMSSAAAPADMRLDAMDNLGVKTQTYGRVMKFINDAVNQGKGLCENIQAYVSNDVKQVSYSALDSKQKGQMNSIVDNVNENCDWILKILRNVEDEMSGAKEFVHPDREYVETLEKEIFDLKQRIDAGMDRDHTAPAIEAEAAKARDSNLLPPTAREQMNNTPERRASIYRIKTMLTQHENEALESKTDDLITQEVIKRRRVSGRQRRMSAEEDARRIKREIEMSMPKSDLGLHSDEPMPAEDIAFLKQLVLPTGRPRRLEETPANSPTVEPNSPASPMEDLGMLDDPEMLPNDDDLKDEDMAPDLLATHRQSQLSVAEWKSMYEGQKLLVEDLQRNIEALQLSRSSDVKSIQLGLDAMRRRCREWYQRLVTRVDEMETEYHQRMEYQLQVNEERVMQAQQEVEQNQADMPGLDDYKKELAHTKNELEKWKNKYFDAEQKKIELHDMMDEKNDELEQLRSQLDHMQQVHTGGGGGVGGGAADEDEATAGQTKETLLEENEQLKEMLQRQESEYELEFKEFEAMANQKLQQLEEYYMNQINDLRQQNADQQNEHERMMAETAQELANAHQRAENAEANVVPQMSPEEAERMVVLQRQNQELRDAIRQFEENVKELNETIDVHATALKERRAELKEEKGIREKLEASIKDLAKKLKKLTQEKMDLEKKMEKKQKKLDKEKDKRKDAKEELSEAREKLENSQNLSHEIVKLKSDFIREQNEWQQTRENFEKEVAKLNQDIIQLRQKHNEEIRSMHEAKVEQIKRTVIEMNNLRDYIRKLQKQLTLIRENDSVSQVGGRTGFAQSTYGGIMSYFGGN